MKKRIFSLLLALLLVWAAPGHAEQSWIDGELTATAGQGGEWYVIALSQTGSYDFTAYRAALLDYLATARVTSATTRQKYALTLLATGGMDDFVTSAMEETIGQQGVMSWVYGLHLLNNGCTSTNHTTASVTEQLLRLQLEDGGWAVSGSIADADVTAMVLQTLAPHRNDPQVRAAVENALALLASRQLEGGDFASYGVPSAESTAQVLSALCCLEIDPAQDERFIKNGHTLLDALELYHLSDGSYSHTQDGPSSKPATAQSFFALAAHQRLMKGQPSIYLLDHTTTVAPKLDWHSIAGIVIMVGALLSCLLLLILKKRSWKNYAAVVIIAILLILGVNSLDIQSAGSYYTPQPTKAMPIGQVTLSIRCDTVAGRAEHIPADGVILPETTFPIVQGDTAISLLTEAARAHSIQMDVSGGYVSGIQYLYEFDFGDLSGWIYQINGQTAGVGSDQYTLQDGDHIAWRYSCDMGNDLK